MFSCKYWKNFMHSFFIEHLRWLVLYGDANQINKKLMSFKEECIPVDTRRRFNVYKTSVSTEVFQILW